MGWGFRVTCPDCCHEWEGIQTSYRFGPWSMLEHPTIDDGFRSWFCPRCYYLLYLPRSIERNVWRRWYAEFLTGPDAESPFLKETAVELNSALSVGRFYTPLAVNLEPGDCPECHQPFEEQTAAIPTRLVCPQCRGRGAVLEGFEFHCQMLRGGHGFT